MNAEQLKALRGPLILLVVNLAFWAVMFYLATRVIWHFP